MEEPLTLREAMLYSQRLAQMSKALWKAIEADWQAWIKPYGLNINEHHILWIAFHLKGATITQVSKFGVMHVSTAFNFSKRLAARGLLTFSKRDDDKRNTYVCLTKEGEDLLLELYEKYNESPHQILDGSLPIKRMYGKMPDFIELYAVIRNIYGDDFMEIFENSMSNIDRILLERQGKNRSTPDKKALTKS